MIILGTSDNIVSSIKRFGYVTFSFLQEIVRTLVFFSINFHVPIIGPLSDRFQIVNYIGCCYYGVGSSVPYDTVICE